VTPSVDCEKSNTYDGTELSAAVATGVDIYII
jgi:hypothetical protein